MPLRCLWLARWGSSTRGVEVFECGSAKGLSGLSVVLTDDTDSVFKLCDCKWFGVVALALFVVEFVLDENCGYGWNLKTKQYIWTLLHLSLHLLFSKKYFNMFEIITFYYYWQWLSSRYFYYCYFDYWVFARAKKPRGLQQVTYRRLQTKFAATAWASRRDSETAKGYPKSMIRDKASCQLVAVVPVCICKQI